MAARKELTARQATDLARYFLGPNWIASYGYRFFLERREYMDNPGSVVEHYAGDGWRDVFRQAGVNLPLRSHYIARGLHVMRDGKAACTAISSTFAKRIAAALNEHEPDRRGI